MACGPLLGALLGDASWRYPFFGTAFLMAIGFLCITVFLKEQPKPARKTSLLDPIKALGHGGLASAAVSAFFYNYTFFTVLAFTSFVLNMTPYKSGAVFFAWGVLLAVFSVLAAPRMQRRFGSLKVLGGSLVLLARRRPGPRLRQPHRGDRLHDPVRRVHRREQHRLHRAGPRGLRRAASGGERGLQLRALVRRGGAPYFAPKIEEWTDVHIPFVVAAVTALLGAVVVVVRRRALTHEAEELEPTARE